MAAKRGQRRRSGGSGVVVADNRRPEQWGGVRNAPLPRIRQPPGQSLKHGEGRDTNSAEGAPTSRSADAAEETGKAEGTACPPDLADATPARRNMEGAVETTIMAKYLKGRRTGAK
eukprot:CAMPEP_0172607200 /NCGR_PEP_ID=MMETSP1068-20121228/27407_1 /TAXON_ID=35684 /ORGANISM="Pseudopedinella elastica, Strain CCMP716" /LENGTH=115 /DNA_ID=CAMNT_0013410139 /DNA_START=661 /DNA_END=1010 /DNA_ORIENTATION=+